MRQYLQLTRAHTAPLEVVPAMLGASIAANEFWSVQVALWGLFGLLYHLAGYGMNSYADWEKGHDRDDKHKQHHPLNTGAMTKSQAKVTVIVLLIATIGHGVGLTVDDPIALSILVLGCISGIAYNKYSKETILKPIPIAIAHTSVYSAAYVDNIGQIHEEFFWLGSLYVFWWVLYQIAISGEIKDLSTDPENLLREWGTRIENNYVIFPFKVELVGAMFKSLSLVAAMLLSFDDRDVTKYSIPVAFIASFLIALNQRLLQNGEFKRDERLLIMSVIELLMLITFVVSAGWIIGANAVITLITASVIWVMVFNQLEWGSFIAPDV